MPPRTAPENPFTSGGVWLRAGLHTHTTNSDGHWTPEETVERYRGAGYDVLCITDHSIVTPVGRFSDEKLLVLPGQEMHPDGPGEFCQHLVAVNLNKTIAGNQLPIQPCIDLARERGALVFQAHPAWCGLIAAEVAELENLSGLEVWNATCLRSVKAGSEAIWDDLLAAGRLLPAIATDDCHRPSPNFRGDFAQAWTMIRAAEKSPEAVMAALDAGRFYATLGPVIEDFRLVEAPDSASGWAAQARFSPARFVGFISRAMKGGGYEFADGEVTEFRHEVKEGAGYVRLMVEDSAGLRAWSGPIPVPDPVPDKKA